MSVSFYLLPRESIASNPDRARAFLDREERQFGNAPIVIDPVNESRKRKLADLLLGMKPAFREVKIQYDEIAKFERIAVEEARRKYRHIEINGAGFQFTFYDRYIGFSVHSRIDSEELDAVVCALSAEGDFIVFDPQADRVLDLRDQFLR